MSILYEKLKKYAVPAASVEDFRRRYTKPGGDPGGQLRLPQGQDGLLPIHRGGQKKFIDPLAVVGGDLHLCGTALHGQVLPPDRQGQLLRRISRRRPAAGGEQHQGHHWYAKQASAHSFPSKAS